MSDSVVQGTCASAFERVRREFEQLLQQPSERGAGVSVYRRGELVVNLWGGTRDKAATQPWQQDTLVNIFSTSKAVAALAVQRALDQGLLNLEKPVAWYWPEYGVEGKRDTLVGWILNHRSGQPALRTPLPDEALFDWERMTTTLAREQPWWQPGRQHGYHPVTYGWLLGEVFRRAAGITLGQYLAEEIAGPLKLDLHLGVNPGDWGRIADMAAAREFPAEGRLYLFDSVLKEPESMTARAFTNPKSLMTSSNSPLWRGMELPSANVHATAGAIATLFGKAVCREGLISDAALQRCQREESAGEDPVLRTHTRFGPGFMLQQAGSREAGFGPGLQSFGHAGSGGSFAFADPEQEMGFAFVMNQMGPYVLVDPRARRLIDAVYACL